MVVFEGERLLWGWVVGMGCSTSELIVMKRCPPTTETQVVLRTILSAGVLVLLAGTAADATWVVDDSGGAGCMGIQTAEVAA